MEHVLEVVFASWAAELGHFGRLLHGDLRQPQDYVAVFPIVLCTLWTLYALRTALARPRPPGPGPLPSYSVIIPFHAERDRAMAAAASLRGVQPPPEQVLLVDDGSPPTTGGDLGNLPPGTRLVRIPERGGKAGALDHGLRHVTSEVVVCMDADTVAVSRDWSTLLAHFRDAQMGAVTGRLWPSAARTLVERAQALDYLAVIGLIKAAETQWGGLLTVSGAWAAYRRAAVTARGGWATDTAAEDIDMSWSLQADGWRLAYDPDWTASVEVAPSWRALWRQRRRWSRGLGRAIRDHGLCALSGRATHLPVVCLTFFSGLWLALTLLVLVGRTVDLIAMLLGGSPVGAIAPHWGLSLGYLGLSLSLFWLQLAVAIGIDRRPARHYPVLVLLAPLYSLYFWLLLLPSAVIGLPTGLLRRDHGVWRRTRRQVESPEAVP